MTAPGGFIPPSISYLPSPTLTNYSSTASTRTTDLLPTQRSTPLKSGSRRESAFINYVDNALLEISRKFTKKFPSEEEDDDLTKDAADGNIGVARAAVVGYSDVESLIEDIERLVGLIWVSGTSSLQIPYLLQIALSLLQYLPPFPPKPTPTFRLLNRLDLAFHTLLQDHKMNGTEKVRLNSIVKVTRAMILRLMEGGGGDMTYDKSETDDDTDADRYEEDDSDDSEMDIKEEGEDTEEEMDVDEDTEGDVSKLSRKYQRPTQKEIDRTERRVEEEGEDEGWEMECARVYSRVLGDIGGEIGGDTIGIVVDE